MTALQQNVHRLSNRTNRIAPERWLTPTSTEHRGIKIIVGTNAFFRAEAKGEHDCNVAVGFVPAWGTLIASRLLLDPSWTKNVKAFDQIALQPPLLASAHLEKPRCFNPSKKLTKFVREVIVRTGGAEDVEAEAQEMIRNAVVRLFNTMAASVRDSGKEPPYALAEERKFADPIAKALLFRVPVGVYDGTKFLEQLLIEVSHAAMRGHIRGPFWRVTADTSGVLRIQVQTKADADISRESQFDAPVAELG